MKRRRLVETTQNPVASALLRAAARDEAPLETPAKVAAAVGVALPASLAALAAKAAVGSAGAAKTGLLGTSMSVAEMAKLVVLSAAFSGTVFVGARQAVRHWDHRAAVVQSSPERHKAVPTGRTAVSSQSLETQQTHEPTSVEFAPERDRPPRLAYTEDARQQQANEIDAPPPSVTGAPSAATAAFPTDSLPETVAAPALGTPLVAAPSGTARTSAAAMRLEREVMLLDASRRALAEGRPGLALSILDQRQAEFRTGALYPESVIVRVQALLALGQTTAAERAAASILAAAPGSRHADALRSLLAAPSPQP